VHGCTASSRPLACWQRLSMRALQVEWAMSNPATYEKDRQAIFVSALSFCANVRNRSALRPWICKLHLRGRSA
jgi:hypothetical protein